jgi:hypothetical protein
LLASAHYSSLIIHYFRTVCPVLVLNTNNVELVGFGFLKYNNVMQTNQQTTQLLNRTIETFNGDAQVISPTDGVSLIDNWISALHSGDASTNPIASTLSELKAELQRGNPDSESIRTFLEQLATQAQQAGETTEPAAQSVLNELAMALQSFGQQLGGEDDPAKTGSQAPMTSKTNTNNNG